MTWDEWLVKFEELERNEYGYKLNDLTGGGIRHATLYGLFQDGYSPARAFSLVCAAARLDKISPLAIPMAIMALLGMAAAIRALFIGEPWGWVGGAVIAVLGASFALWVRHTIRIVAHLAAKAKADAVAGGGAKQSIQS